MFFHQKVALFFPALVFDPSDRSFVKRLINSAVRLDSPPKKPQHQEIPKMINIICG